MDSRYFGNTCTLLDKCDKNEDRNCNNSEKDQKLSATNDCNIKNHNHDESYDNANLNTEDGLTVLVTLLMRMMSVQVYSNQTILLPQN